MHVSKIDSHKSHQAVGESSKNSGNFTLDMSLVAIVEGCRRSPVLRLGAERFHATSYLKQSQTNTDKFIDKGTIFIVTLGTPQFLIGQHVVGEGEDVDPLHSSPASEVVLVEVVKEALEVVSQGRA